MRQIGTLPTQVQAERFTAYLITQGFPAVAEPEGEAWEIWVRDEDHLDEARQSLDDFRQDPDNARYAGVIRQATSLLQEEAKRREEAQKRVVQVGGRWRRSGPRKHPFVTVVIFLCSVIFVLSGLGQNPKSTPVRVLSFSDTMQHPSWDRDSLQDRLIDIRSGQVWRIVTPIFLHGDILHLLFNMLMFFFFASRIEERKGAWKLALFMLAIAVPSNLAQALAPSDWGPFSGGPFFLGMSGVVYGLLGYLWMKTLYAPQEGLFINGGTVVFLLIWLLLGFTGILDGMFGGSIANLAHGVGLLAGMGLGYFRS
jgi:GlpG protein